MEVLFEQGIMMMVSGFFRRLPDLPKPVWRYPLSYIVYGSWALQVTEDVLHVTIFKLNYNAMFSRCTFLSDRHDNLCSVSGSSLTCYAQDQSQYFYQKRNTRPNFYLVKITEVCPN